MVDQIIPMTMIRETGILSGKLWNEWIHTAHSSVDFEIQLRFSATRFESETNATDYSRADCAVSRKLLNLTAVSLLLSLSFVRSIVRLPSASFVYSFLWSLIDPKRLIAPAQRVPQGSSHIFTFLSPIHLLFTSDRFALSNIALRPEDMAAIAISYLLA